MQSIGKTDISLCKQNARAAGKKYMHDKIKSIVEKHCLQFEEISLRDTLMLQRYFLHEYIKWLPLRRIAEMTGGAGHWTVISSIKAVTAHKRFILPKYLIRNEIEKIWKAR